MRYLRLGYSLPENSAVPRRSANLNSTPGSFSRRTLKQKSPPILPGERRKLNISKNTAYWAGRSSGESQPLVRAARKQCHHTIKSDKVNSH